MSQSFDPNARYPADDAADGQLPVVLVVAEEVGGSSRAADHLTGSIFILVATLSRDDVQWMRFLFCMRLL